MTWQIWNEQNSPKYFAPKANVRSYAKLLKSAGDAIHAAEPGADIILGGMWGPRLGEEGRDPGHATTWPRSTGCGESNRASTRSRSTPTRRAPTARSRPVTSPARSVKKAHDKKAGMWVTEIGWAGRRTRPRTRHQGQEGPGQGAHRRLRAYQARRAATQPARHLLVLVARQARAATRSATGVATPDCEPRTAPPNRPGRRLSSSPVDPGAAGGRCSLRRRRPARRRGAPAAGGGRPARLLWRRRRRDRSATADYSTMAAAEVGTAALRARLGADEPSAGRLRLGRLRRPRRRRRRRSGSGRSRSSSTRRVGSRRSTATPATRPARRTRRGAPAALEAWRAS